LTALSLRFEGNYNGQRVAHRVQQLVLLA